MRLPPLLLKWGLSLRLRLTGLALRLLRGGVLLLALLRLLKLLRLCLLTCLLLLPGLFLLGALTLQGFILAALLVLLTLLLLFPLNLFGGAGIGWRGVDRGGRGFALSALSGPLVRRAALRVLLRRQCLVLGQTDRLAGERLALPWRLRLRRVGGAALRS